jgi:uncharacterized protein YjiS (DUF1127 family)
VRRRNYASSVEARSRTIFHFFVNNQLFKLCVFHLAAAQHYCFSKASKCLFSLQTNDRRRRTDERKKDTMIAALARFIQEWKRYNQSLSELSRLGDRELADIGISRSDIPRVAWNAAHEH